MFYSRTKSVEQIVVYFVERLLRTAQRFRPVVLNRGYTYPLGVRSTETRGTNHHIFSGIHALKFKPRHARPEIKKMCFRLL